MKRLKLLAILNIIIFTIIITSLTNSIVKANADVNQDGIVNAMDMIIVKRYVIGCAPLSKYELKLADINQDGVVDDKDIQIIKAYVLYE